MILNGKHIKSFNSDKIVWKRNEVLSDLSHESLLKSPEC